MHRPLPQHIWQRQLLLRGCSTAASAARPPGASSASVGWPLGQCNSVPGSGGCRPPLSPLPKTFRSSSKLCLRHGWTPFVLPRHPCHLGEWSLTQSTTHPPRASCTSSGTINLLDMTVKSARLVFAHRLASSFRKYGPPRINSRVRLRQN